MVERPPVELPEERVVDSDLVETVAVTADEAVAVAGLVAVRTRMRRRNGSQSQSSVV